MRGAHANFSIWPRPASRVLMKPSMRNRQLTTIAFKSKKPSPPVSPLAPRQHGNHPNRQGTAPAPEAGAARVVRAHHGQHPRRAPAARPHRASARALRGDDHLRESPPVRPERGFRPVPAYLRGGLRQAGRTRCARGVPPGRSGDVPGAAGVRGRPAGGREQAGRPLSSRALPRHGHGGAEAVQHRAATGCGVRQEGLSAVAHREPHGRSSSRCR